MAGKRFLFLITHYYPHVYGAELFAMKLAEHLVSQGHWVDVVTGKWDDRWARYENINGVSIHRVQVNKTRFIQTILFILPQWLKAKELLSKHRYDYVHAHIFPSLMTAALLKTAAKKVVTIQGGDLADYQEIYGPFASVLRPVIAWSLSRYQTLHCVSTDLAKQVKHLTNRQAIVVPNGVDAGLLKKQVKASRIRTLYHLPTKGYLAISPSRLTDKNNLTETIKAINLLRQQNHLVYLAIAGTGHLQDSLIQQVQDLKLSEQVFFLGHVKHDELMDLISASDCLIRVSLKEGFGIALLEGMALGKPVLASVSGGLSDFISNETAYVPGGHDARAIAETWDVLLKDPNRILKTSRAQKIVSKNFTWEKVHGAMETKVYGI